MPGREPRPGDIYQHFKGNKYQVTAIAVDAQTQEKCVVYQALYGEFITYVRKYAEFVSEVDKDKYPQVNCRYRYSSPEELEKDEVVLGFGANQEEQKTNNQVEQVTDEEKKEELTAQGYEMRELKHPEDEGEVNPDLLAFLEAETTKEKLEVLDQIQERITESILCAIEASMDISYEEESIEERVYYIKNYLRTRERYEGTRLR